MDALFNSTLNARITVGDLSGLTAADLISLKNSETFLVSSKGATKWFQDHPNIAKGSFTPDELRVINRKHSDMMTGSALTVGNFERISWDNQATVGYSASGTTIYKMDGSQTLYAAGPVPIVKPRFGAARIAVFFCSLFHLKQGEIKDIISYSEMEKRFSIIGSSVDVRDLGRVRLTFVALMKKYPAYVMAVSDETTVQGNAFLDMVINALQVSDWMDYFAIHDVVCTRFLKAVNLIENPDKSVTIRDRMAYIDKDGKMVPYIPDSSIKLVTKTWAQNKMTPEVLNKLMDYRAKMGHWPMFLIGPVHTRHAFPGVADNFKGAAASYSAGNTLRGSQYAGMGLFLQSAGFSSMSSLEHNKMCLLVAMAMNALKVHDRVCIYATGGQLAVLSSSMESHLAKEEWGRFCFVLEKTERTSVSVHLQDKIELVCPKDCHIIRIFDALPESLDKDLDPTKKFGDAASIVRRQLVGGDGYTIFASVCHAIYWGYDGIKDKVIDAFSDKLRRSNVFQFRAPFDMRGIVSTLDRIQFANEKELDMVNTPQEWCKRVCSCNANANLFFLKPIGFFSSISNLLKPNFKSLGLFNQEMEGWTYAAVSEKDTSFVDDTTIGGSIPLVGDTEEIENEIGHRKMQMASVEIANEMLKQYAPSEKLDPPVPEKVVVNSSNQVKMTRRAEAKKAKAEQWQAKQKIVPSVSAGVHQKKTVTIEVDDTDDLGDLKLAVVPDINSGLSVLAGGATDEVNDATWA